MFAGAVPWLPSLRGSVLVAALLVGAYGVDAGLAATAILIVSYASAHALRASARASWRWLRRTRARVSDIKLLDDHKMKRFQRNALQIFDLPHHPRRLRQAVRRWRENRDAFSGDQIVRGDGLRDLHDRATDETARQKDPGSDASDPTRRMSPPEKAEPSAAPDPDPSARGSVPGGLNRAGKQKSTTTTTTSTVRRALELCDLCRGLDPAQLAELERFAREVPFAAGEDVFRTRRVRADELCVVASGSVAVGDDAHADDEDELRFGNFGSEPTIISRPGAALNSLLDVLEGSQGAHERAHELREGGDREGGLAREGGPPRVADAASSRSAPTSAASAAGIARLGSALAEAAKLREGAEREQAREREQTRERERTLDPAASEGNATAPAADVLDAFHEARCFSGVTGGASVKESPSTLAVRAARAAPECPAAVLAASRLLRAAAGAEASARPGVDAAASGRRADLSKSEEVRGGDETTENSSENTVNALSTALETHGSYLNAPSRHLRAATCAFLRDVERYVDRKKVFDAAAEETDVSDAAANPSATPASLGAVFDRFHLVFARDPADASGTGVMAYAKAAQGAVRSAARLAGREGSGSGGKKGFPAEWAGPVAACALGAFRSRLATLWPEAITLVGAVTKRAQNRAAWDAVFAELEATQAECLRAHEEAAARVAAAESFSKKGERASDGVDASRGGGPKKAFIKGPSLSSESKGETAEGAPSPPSSGCALALQSKARAFAYPVEQGTERWTRLGLVLRSVAASPEAAARDPKPLALAFLAFDAPKPDGSRRGGRAYRAGLREWLAVHRDALGGGRKVRALEGGVGEGVRASLERCVSADEPATAQLAVRCLGQWRLPHLDSPELAERVARVAHPDTCRDELVGLSLSGDDAVVSAEHRPAFASLIVRALLPRLRKRSGKHAPLRAAALAWIGRLDAREIAPLIREVVQPLEPPPPTDASTSGSSWSDALLLTASCGPGSETSAALWWDLAASEASLAHLERLVREGSKRPAGFLRAAADATRAMGEHVGAYLDPIATCATALLRVASRVCEEKAEAREKAALLLSEEDGHPTRVPGSISSSSSSLATAKEAKEVRALAARLLASILARHPSFDVATRHWPVARDALAPMAARLAAEAGGASPPPALDVVAALAEDERLATLLLREEERASPAEKEEEEEEAEVSKGVAKKREAELSAGVRTDDAVTKPRPRGFLSEAWRALGAPSASPATRAAALAVAERLADQAEAAADDAGARGTRGARDDEDAHVSARLLRRTAPGLLAALQSALAARANPDANARARLGARLGPRGGGGTKGPRAPNNAGARSTERELAVLRRLGPLLGRDAASAAVADTLVPVLAIRRLDEKAAEEVLRALEAVLPAAGTAEGGAGEAGDVRRRASGRTRCVRCAKTESHGIEGGEEATAAERNRPRAASIRHWIRR